MPLLSRDQRTADWHADRKGRITASIAAACLHLDPYTSAQKAYRIVRGEEPDRDNDFMKWGRQHEMEALLAYEVETGRSVDVTGFWVHETEYWLGASPDGLVGEQGLVEVKCPVNLPTSVPIHHRIQMLVQMVCTNRSFVDYFSWTPAGSFLARVNRPSPGGPSLQGLIKALARFRDNYVLTGTPPPRKGSKACSTKTVTKTLSGGPDSVFSV